jgi:hypothetical protein
MMLGAQLDGGAPLVTDLPAWTTTYKLVSDRTNPDGGAQYMLLQPGDPSTSLISVLSGERVPDGQKPSEKTQMPPEVSHLVDTVGHQKLDDWISALPP